MSTMNLSGERGAWPMATSLDVSSADNIMLRIAV